MIEELAYLGRHGTGRVAKAALVGAVTPLMMKTKKNPGGLPISVFDSIRAGVAGDRSQFYKDLTLPFTDSTGPGQKFQKASASTGGCRA